MSTITTGGSRAGYCRFCYTTAIERLCAGFVIVKQAPKTAVTVPPLDKYTAADVRKAAREILATWPAGSSARHAEHTSVQGWSS